MLPSQRPDQSVGAIPAEIRARVMEAALDELTRWGVERFSIEALAEPHPTAGAGHGPPWLSRRREPDEVLGGAGLQLVWRR